MRILKKTVLFLLIILLIIGSAGFSIAYLYGDKIQSYVVENLNKGLKTEIEVKSVDFSIWENFPRASVVFFGVVIHAVDAKNDTLLSAEKISAQFNLIDLYHKNYKLIALEVVEGKCMMQVDNSGRENYIFWENKATDTSSFSTQLEKVSLDQVDFVYQDHSKEVDIGFTISKADVNGNLNDDLTTLKIKAALESSRVNIGKTRLLGDRSLDINLKGKVDNKKEAILFEDADLAIDEMNFILNGQYHFGSPNAVDLNITSENTQLSKAIALLPPAVREKLKSFDVKGKASFSGKINGDFSSSIAPHYHFDFTINNGELKDQTSDLSFKETYLKGQIDNGVKRNASTTKLQIERFQSQLSQGKLEGNFELENFKKPYYKYEGKIKFDLNEVVALFKLDQLEKPKGIIETDLLIEGGLRDIKKYELEDWKRALVKGQMNLSDLAFSIRDNHHTFSSISAGMIFNNNSVDVQGFTGKIDQTELNIDGKFNNLIAFIIEENEPLFVDAALTSDLVDLQQILKPSSGKKSKESDFEIPAHITVYLDTKIEELKYEGLQIRNLQALFIAKGGRLDARGVKFNSQEGSVEGDLFIKENSVGMLRLYSELDLKRVNIKKLFTSFKNFGQNTLRAEHLSGKLDAQIKFNSEWTKQFEIDLKTIEVQSDVVIDDGVLKDFKPLESLSKYVELEELKEVKFEQIRNQVLIKDEVITLPKFQLYSSAMNMGIYGTHTFKNEIDYHFTLLLSEVLGKKAKKPKSNEFGYVEEDGSGKSELFLKMTGTVDNPIIKYDTKQLKEKLKNKFKTEKQVFKSLLKEEFGLFKKDTTLPAMPSNKSRQSPFQVEVDSSYVKKSAADKNEKGLKGETGNSNEKGDKSKFGKFLDKIAKPNEDEFVEPDDN